MKRYIGIKIIEAEPMMKLTRLNALDKDSKAFDPNDDEAGYKVRYEDGYESWSPKEQFEEAYRECDCMNFGLAMEAMKKGLKVARNGWNGKGMFLLYVEGSKKVTLKTGSPYDKALSTEIGVDIRQVDINPHIDMYTASGEMQPGWLASQTDMLADDWRILD